MSEHKADGRIWFSVYGWFALLAGSLSIFQLLETAFNIGLAPMLAHLIDYYRALLYPLLDFLLGSLPANLRVNLTPTQKDIAIAALVVLAAIGRIIGSQLAGGLTRSVAGAADAAVPYVLAALQRLGQFAWWLVQVLVGAGISYVVYSYPPIKSTLDSIWT